MGQRFDRIVEAIRSVLKESPPGAAYLFGSYTRREEDPCSDVDLMILAETCLPFVGRFRDDRRLWESVEAPLEPFVFTPQEGDSMCRLQNPPALRILQEGMLTYGSPPQRGAEMVETDGLPAGAPSEVHSRKHARQALEGAGDILEFTSRTIGQAINS